MRLTPRRRHEHQAYYGDRTPEAIAAFVELQVKGCGAAVIVIVIVVVVIIIFIIITTHLHPQVQSLEKKAQITQKMAAPGLPMASIQGVTEYLRALQVSHP